MDMENLNSETPQPRRHGFISFWLIFCLAGRSVMLIAGIILLLQNISLYEGETLYLMLDILLLLASAVGITGFAMLLKRKRIGFFLVIIETVTSILASAGIDGFNYTLVAPIIGVFILYAILQISTEGVPYWQTLDD